MRWRVSSANSKTSWSSCVRKLSETSTTDIRPRMSLTASEWNRRGNSLDHTWWTWALPSVSSSSLKEEVWWWMAMKSYSSDSKTTSTRAPCPSRLVAMDRCRAPWIIRISEIKWLGRIWPQSWCLFILRAQILLRMRVYLCLLQIKASTLALGWGRVINHHCLWGLPRFAIHRLLNLEVQALIRQYLY